MRNILQLDHSPDAEARHRQFARDVLKGLSQPLKSIPCKYIYDEIGSELFCKIMELPEYYLTDCEIDCLQLHKEAIHESIGPARSNIIELGAGDGVKTKILIEHFMGSHDNFRYFPIDISEKAIFKLFEVLNREYPELNVQGLVTDYFQGLNWLSQKNTLRKIVLFLGSNIGNFSPDEAETFLKHLRDSINTGDYLLIGFDLVKDIDMMVRAYNDAQGVTKQFISNVLSRINRELGGEFNLESFRYLSTWDASEGAVKSYLVSTREHRVHMRGLNTSVTFKIGEAIHIESSHKFTVNQCKDMADSAGFEVVANYFDAKKYFVDSLWIAV